MRAGTKPDPNLPKQAQQPHHALGEILAFARMTWSAGNETPKEAVNAMLQDSLAKERAPAHDHRPAPETQQTKHRRFAVFDPGRKKRLFDALHDFRHCFTMYYISKLCLTFGDIFTYNQLKGNRVNKQHLINWAAGVFCPTLLLLAVWSISLFHTPVEADCEPATTQLELAAEPKSKEILDAR